MTADTARVSVHLCNNLTSLLYAAASLTRDRRAGAILYLEDISPLPAGIASRLLRILPAGSQIQTSTDAAERAGFETLPGFFPAVIRRNLAFRGLRPMRPFDWRGGALGAQAFDVAYLYHSGFFTAKPVAGRAEWVILREDGLNTYATVRIRGLKSVLRGLSGLPPRRQVYGEERWIDVVEAARPGELPAQTRKKARRNSLSETLAELDPSEAAELAAIFLKGTPLPAAHGGQTALLLTQPLDQIGFCSAAENAAIYEGIAKALAEAGYAVTVKHHPREASYPLPSAAEIPASFPIEAWPFLQRGRFDLAVAICSASLANRADGFARKSLQLVPPSQFYPEHFPRWRGTLTQAIAALP